MKNLSTEAKGQVMILTCLGNIYKRKLTDFYLDTDRNYPSCLDHPPFIIIRDKEEIAAAGYSRRTKALVTLDPTHPYVIKAVKDGLRMKERIENW